MEYTPHKLFIEIGYLTDADLILLVSLNITLKPKTGRVFKTL